MPSINLTNNAIFKVSKELINLRTFNKSLLTVVGSPSVTTAGIAKDMDLDNNFYYNGLSIASNEIIVGFQGEFYNSSKSQCPWALTGFGTSSLYALMTNSSASVYFGNTEICKLTKQSFQGTSLPVNLKVKVTEESCEIFLFCENKIFNITAPLPESINLSAFTTIAVGCHESYYWEGKINLPSLSVSDGINTLYTPSTEPSFNISKIIISDGQFPLTDSSGSVLNHMYEIPVTELVRSSNTLLISTQIEDDLYLNIREIGIYDTSGEKPSLFAVIDNLNINKSSDLPYDLFFTVDLSLNIVNVSGFPGVGDIIVTPQEYVTAFDFENLKNIEAYSLCNLERLIKNNAYQVGFNKPQVFYRLQRGIQKSEECYNTIENYLKLNSISQNLSEGDLLQYYHIPSLPPASVKTTDVCDNSRYMNITGTKMLGNFDFINFNSPCTLFVKAFLQDMEDKIILIKRDAGDRLYFSLELLNGALTFTVFSKTGQMKLSKEISIEEYPQYIEQPILVGITYNGNQIFGMYKNFELVAQETGTLGTKKTATSYHLSNFLSNTENPKLYVSDIVLMQDVATPQICKQVCYLLNYHAFL